MRQSHLSCDKHMYRGRFCRLFGGAKAPPVAPCLRDRRREAVKRGRYPREAEQLKAMKVALRSHLAALAYFLCGIAAAIWALEAFGVALHNSQDNDWGPARVGPLQALPALRFLSQAAFPSVRRAHVPSLRTNSALASRSAILAGGKGHLGHTQSHFRRGPDRHAISPFLIRWWMALRYLGLHRTVRGSPVSHQC